MPLRDHFHPPLSTLRHWESFHARWASVIADALEADLLPPGYFAEVQIHVGSRIEVDIAMPAPVLTMPALFPERLEILIFQTEAGPSLVSAIELISPRNKDRPESRRAFATKCANYLHHGIGLVTVDVVTNRNANLHNEMIELMQLDDAFLLAADLLHAVSYRPRRSDETDVIDVWPNPLTVAEPLPVTPLALDKGQFVRLDLESTYNLACERTRLPQ